MTLFGRRIPMAFSLVVWLAAWEVVGRLKLVLLLPPFSEVFLKLFDVMGTRRFAEAVTVTFQAFAIGMAFALVIGIGLGIWMGRNATVDYTLSMWVNIFESSPLTAIVPALMALLGFGMSTMVLTVFLFAVWVIALDTQVGVKHINASLLEMGRSFGAKPRQLYWNIIYPAALPELLSGVRLGLIRGVKGVVIGQLLIAVTGIGYLFELYSRNFLMADFWALILIIFAFAFITSEIVAFFERKVEFYASGR